MKRSNVVERSPDVLAGTPVFSGTRVPVRTLLEYLGAGDPLDDFLENFPAVTRQQAIAFLDESARASGSTSRPGSKCLPTISWNSASIASSPPSASTASMRFWLGRRSRFRPYLQAHEG